MIGNNMGNDEELEYTHLYREETHPDFYAFKAEVM